MPQQNDLAYYRDLARDNPRLMDLIIRFNCQFAAYAHPLRKTALGAKEGSEASGGRLLQSPRALRRISSGKGLHAFFGLERTLAMQGVYDFRKERMRLVLLSPDLLERLQAYCGLSVHASQVAKLIRQAEVQAMIQAFGRQAYMFAIKKAPFLPGEFNTLFDKVDAAPASALIGRIGRTGRQVLGLCLHDAPAALAARAGMKFTEQSDPFSIRLPEATADQVAVAWQRVKKILLHELALENKWLFT